MLNLRKYGNRDDHIVARYYDAAVWSKPVNGEKDLEKDFDIWFAPLIRHFHSELEEQEKRFNDLIFRLEHKLTFWGRIKQYVQRKYWAIRRRLQWK